MSRLTRYVTREILSYAAGSFAVIVAVFLVRRSAVLLAEMTEAALPLGPMLELLGLRTLMALPSLLPAVFYLAVLLAFVRLNQDREVAALEACGVARGRIYRSVLPLALAGACLTAGMSFFVRPWAATEYLRGKARATADAGTDQMRPGRFYELAWGGGQVFFAERRSESDPRWLEDVFFQEEQNGRTAIHLAARALEERDEVARERVVGLFDGRRYDFSAKGESRDITEYGQMTFRFPLPPEEEPTIEEEEKPWSELRRSEALVDRAELEWRLAMPLSVLVLCLLALPMTPPTRGRGGGSGGRLFAALLVYIIYRQILGTGKKWIMDGQLPADVGLLPIHAGFALLAVLLLVGQAARLHGGVRPWLASGMAR